MLSNAYLVAKIRFGTAEIEPAKNFRTNCNFCQFCYFANRGDVLPVGRPRRELRGLRDLAADVALDQEGRALPTIRPFPPRDFDPALSETS